MFTPKSNLNTSITGGGGGGLDRSFTSASARAMASAAKRRKSTGIFSGAPGRSPFNTPGRSTPVGRSLQTSQIIETGGQYTVESYGSFLPALVMEALAYADKNAELSSVISPNGWAWLVAGRGLLIWKYRADSNKIGNHQFRELTLPPSDLAHRAQLVTVFSHLEGQIPSCIAVSPEGFVRYWPNITHEGSYFEVSTELQGQECDSLVFLCPSFGCLLATTTSTLLQVVPLSVSHSGASQTSRITVKQLKAPSGLLGGITKKVSSLVFGSMPTQAPEARLVGISAIDGVTEMGGKCIVVISARALQKWILFPKNCQAEKLIYECNVDKLIHEAFVDHVWGRAIVGNSQLQVWLISVQPVSSTNTLMVLTAAVNSYISQQLFYALVSIDVSGETPPTTVSNFLMLKQHSEYYQESAESHVLAHRFILCRSTAYIYNENSVLCIPVSGSENEEYGSDRVDFSSAGDAILGGGRSNNNPLFFSTTHGIVAITHSQSLNQSSVLQDSILEQSVDMSFSAVYDGTKTDTGTRLQAAFMHFNRKNILQAQSLLEELFPLGEANDMDNAMCQLSIHLLDDTPATDPRWAEANQLLGSQSGSGGGPSTTSLIIINQINEKLVAHECFLKFLQQTGLWQRLGVTSLKNRSIHTRLLLAEHCEMLNVASELRSLHSEHSSLVDAAIKSVMSDQDQAPVGKLSYSDLFYRKISLIETIVWGLLEAEEDVLSADLAPRDASLTIHNVNLIVLALLKAARDTKIISGISTLQISNETQIEYVPWLSSEGPRGTRVLLDQQHKITVEIGLSRAEDGETRGRLYNQLIDMTDFILSGFQPHLTSIAAINAPRHGILLEEYQRIRYALIQPLVKNEQYNEAVSLAEKFCDFRTLIEVCDKTENQEKLNQYMKTFGSQGFSDFVFRWYLETGKRGKLLSHADMSDSLGNNARNDLTKFLEGYSSLAWLHQVNSREFADASETLKHLALEETTYLTKKKTLLSLSKLCSLAEGSSTPSKEIDPGLLLEEDLVLYQEQIPKPTLDSQSLDPDTMRVLSPKDIIMMYISPTNSLVNEFELKKALDILPWIETGEDLEELKRLIWVRAISRDTWDQIDTDNPVDTLSDTTLFKTVELAYMQGGDIKKLLVPCDDLLKSEELTKLKENTSFEYIIRACYEKVRQTTEM